MKSEIASKLREAQLRGEIRARGEVVSVLNAFLVNYSKRFMFVNTNWDTVVDERVTQHLATLGSLELNILHVHGTAQIADSLFLPSEVTREAYRSGDEELAVGQLQGALWRGLENATRVVIYGLSLSPLDAELCQNVAAGLSSKVLEEVFVVSPDHAQVAHRVNLLLDPRYPARVIGYHPARLTEPVDYTVVRGPTDVPEVRDAGA